MTRILDTFKRTAWRGGKAAPGTRALAEEVAVSISYNGSAHAVLMATPADLEDLAYGFSVSEGIVGNIGAIETVAIERFDLGLDLQVRVREEIAVRLAERRRSMAGPVGCGMCGLESLEAATRPLRRVTAATHFGPNDIGLAARSIVAEQRLNQMTGAAHAAGFFKPGEPVRHVREDVGRHNALDKTIGALLRAGVEPASGGVVVTSRVSVELVQKVAVAGGGLIAAVSAPTAMAVRTAEAANVTVAAVVRGDEFEVFSGQHRIAPGEIGDVA